MLFSYRSFIVVLAYLFLGGLIYFNYAIVGLITYLIVLMISELILEYIVDMLREKFQWLITKKKDYLPKLDPTGLKKFFLHGYDPYLGWVRKPNTDHDESSKYGKTVWHTNSFGSRLNPEFEDKKSIISCYGDSFTFSRQVNDDETWPYYISQLTDTNVLNFGIGNYGIDQALLRLKVEYPKHKTKIVIMGVVPDTVSRIMSVWKHFYEYGNTFAFKPRFKLTNGKLELVNNFIDSEQKYFEYEKYISSIISEDFFYKYKFTRELIRFPYLISVFRNPLRNISLIYYNLMSMLMEKLGKDFGYKDLAMKKIMTINKNWRLKLYGEKEVRELLVAIVKEFVNYSKEQNFIPVFAILPQKDDVLYIKKKGNFYQAVKDELKDLLVIDLADNLVNVSNLDNLYSDNSEYGGHYSKHGNEFVARVIHDKLKEKNLI